MASQHLRASMRSLVKLNGCRHADTRRNPQKARNPAGSVLPSSKVCQNCKQKFTPDLPQASLEFAPSLTPCPSTAARKVAQVKERGDQGARWRSSRRPQRMSLNAGPSCKKSPGSGIATMVAFHATWALATGMWHAALAQPGTTPPSSSTLEHSQSLRAMQPKAEPVGLPPALRKDWRRPRGMAGVAKPARQDECGYLIRFAGDGQAASKNRTN
jgi:hypothetical protein